MLKFLAGIAVSLLAAWSGPAAGSPAAPTPGSPRSINLHGAFTRPAISLTVDRGTAAGGTPLAILGTDLDRVGSITVDTTSVGCSALPASLAGVESPEAVFKDFQETSYKLSQRAAPPRHRAPYRSLTPSGACLAAANRLVVLMPPHAPGAVEIQVLGSSAPFLYVAASAPVVNAIDPQKGTAAGGGSVTVWGTGFTGLTGATFGGVPVSGGLIPWSDQLVTILSWPAGTAGSSVDIQITTPAGTSAVNPADVFTYTVPAVPSVIAVDPRTGPSPGGSFVYIYGSGFLGASEVDFGTTAAFSPTILSDGEIGVSSPLGSVGPVDVTVITAGNRSVTGAADQFTYSAPVAPTIATVAPGSGAPAGGTDVYITGSGFLGTTSLKFGLATASFAVLSNTIIEATSPSGSGSVTISVVTGGGATTSAATFTYNTVPPPTLPVVDALSIDSGTAAGGTTVVIFGSGFSGVTSVQFGSAQAFLQPVCFFTCDSQIFILFDPPGSSGATVDVRVTTPAGTSAIDLEDHFTYFAPPPPAVIAVVPGSGLESATASVEIFGSGLAGFTSVDFGPNLGLFPPSFQLDTQISGSSPPGTGTVDVRVTTPAGTSGIVAGDRFVYLPEPAPAVTAVGPSRGPAAGGTAIFIEGAGFSQSIGVRVGGVSVPYPWAVFSDDLMQVTTPPGLGMVDVQVTTPLGTSPAVAADLFTYLSPPFAPVGASALVGVGGPGTVRVSWSAPFDGGSAITSYTVNCLPACPAVVVGGSSLTAVVSGLDGFYRFTVTATNQYGMGPPSAPTPLVNIRGPIAQAASGVPSSRTGVTQSAAGAPPGR